jgi:hypothetical protein
MFVTDSYCNRNDDLRMEMFPGEEMRGYILNVRKMSVRIDFENGMIDINLNNYFTVGKLKKKLCRKYYLGLDIILTANEKRITSSDLLIQFYEEDFWIHVNVFRELTMVGLRRIKYHINFQEEIFEVEAMVCNAWNRMFKYITSIC